MSNEDMFVPDSQDNVKIVILIGNKIPAAGLLPTFPVKSKAMKKKAVFFMVIHQLHI